MVIKGSYKMIFSLPIFFVLSILSFFPTSLVYGGNIMEWIKGENGHLENMRTYKSVATNESAAVTYTNLDNMKTSILKSQNLLIGRTSIVSRNVYATEEERLVVLKNLKHQAVIHFNSPQKEEDYCQDIEKAFRETKDSHMQKHLAALWFMKKMIGESLRVTKIIDFPTDFNDRDDFYKSFFYLKGFLIKDLINEPLKNRIKNYTMCDLKVFFPQNSIALFGNEDKPVNNSYQGDETYARQALNRQALNRELQRTSDHNTKHVSNPEAFAPSLFFEKLCDSVFQSSFSKFFEKKGLITILYQYLVAGTFDIGKLLSKTRTKPFKFIVTDSNVFKENVEINFKDFQHLDQDILELDF
jgi:hypothetical protein